MILYKELEIITNYSGGVCLMITLIDAKKPAYNMTRIKIP